MPKKKIRVVAAIIQNTSNQYLITQRLTNAHLGGYWEFPGGTVEPGENPSEALSRELKEELDIRVNINDLFWRETFEYDTKIVDISFFNCHLKSANQVIKKLGVADFRWIPVDEFEEFKFPEADQQLINKMIVQV